MNFFDDRELAKRFKVDAVPQAERIKYFLIYTLYASVISTTVFCNYFYEPANHWDIVADISFVVLNVLGIYWLYRINKKGDNKELIERVTCIGFPVFIQSVLFIFGLGFIIGIGMGVYSGVTGESVDYANEPTTAIDAIGVILMLMYYYIRLCYSIKIASGQD